MNLQSHAHSLTSQVSPGLPFPTAVSFTKKIRLRDLLGGPWNVPVPNSFPEHGTKGGHFEFSGLALKKASVLMVQGGGGAGQGAQPSHSMASVAAALTLVGGGGSLAPDPCARCESGRTPPHPGEWLTSSPLYFPTGRSVEAHALRGRNRAEKGPVETVILFSEALSEKDNFLEKLMESLNESFQEVLSLKNCLIKL